jgi:hypothetical protein
MPFRNTIKKVEVYQINNTGKYYDSLNKAKQAVVNNVSDVIDKRLIKISEQSSSILSANDIFSIVCMLCGDYDKTAQFVKDINNAFADIEEDLDLPF